MKRNLEIDRLRAVAILMTIVCHIPAPFNLPKDKLDLFNLSVGVDIFFVISGYLMTMHLYPKIVDIHSGQNQPFKFVKLLKSFYTRRAFRLFPQAWLWLGVILIGSFAWPEVFAAPNLVIRNVFSALGFVENVAAQFDYLYHPMIHVYWSLSLEEQFYLFLPLLLFFFKRKGTIIFTVLYLTSRFVLNPDPQSDWMFRLDALLFGVMLGFLFQTDYKNEFEPKFLRNKPIIALALSIVLTISLTVIPGTVWQSSLFFILQGILAAGVVFFALYGKGYSFPLPFGIRGVLDWFGTRSYALYLIHVPVFYVVWRLMPNIPFAESQPKSMFIFCSLVTMCLLAEISYRLIETPFRNKGKPITQNKQNLQGNYSISS